MDVKDFLEVSKLSDCRISPDGRVVAYETTKPDFGRDENQTILWLISADGGQPRRLTAAGNATSPTWSPEGRRLAFTSDRTGVSELFVIDVDGGEAVQLSHGGASGPLSWSPDGGRIAYSHIVTVEQQPGDVSDDVWKRRPYVLRQRTYKIDGTGISTRSHPQIFTVDVATHETRQVTFDETDSLEAAFSPTGQQLAIARSRPGVLKRISPTSGWPTPMEATFGRSPTTFTTPNRCPGRRMAGTSLSTAARTPTI